MSVPVLYLMSVLEQHGWVMPQRSRRTARSHRRC